MAFSHRVATLVALVLVPVSVAGMSHVLGEDPPAPVVAPDVELAPSSGPTAPRDTGQAPAPDEEVAPRPRPTETPLHDDDRRQPDHGDDRHDDDGNGDDWNDDGDDWDDD
ncbi:hypothetical protein [Streptomyces profundus]|uniref:hypothetical protein n=1 Tax=Streptomyces profundus TaxID=2867410 RepID=UPI001D161219|nr:hypothetical protein [Streptomyces sp. MA3_2.13]UED87828.1 hypothetical protein K4G22_29520 [Streptomyces sp. MA3_2.13]